MKIRQRVQLLAEQKKKVEKFCSFLTQCLDEQAVAPARKLKTQLERRFRRDQGLSD